MYDLGREKPHRAYTWTNMNFLIKQKHVICKTKIYCTVGVVLKSKMKIKGVANLEFEREKTF